MAHNPPIVGRGGESPSPALYIKKYLGGEELCTIMIEKN
jgi:hypothetical protein